MGDFRLSFAQEVLLQTKGALRGHSGIPKSKGFYGRSGKKEPKRVFNGEFKGPGFAFLVIFLFLALLKGLLGIIFYFF